MTETLRKIKLVLRLLGAHVSLLIIAQAVWIFCNPKTDDFWDFCHWLGQGLLGLGVGGFGCFMELRGTLTKVATSFRSFALNRMALTFFYFWLGCYVMGGMGVVLLGQGWRTVAHITGITAWVVAIGDLMISCTAVGKEQDEPVIGPKLEDPDQEPERPQQNPGADTYGNANAMEKGEVGNSPLPNQPGVMQAARNAAADKDHTSPKAEEPSDPPDRESTPEPQWNTSYNNPFGSA